VDVTVRFPQGIITEWYPQALEVGPSAYPPNKLATALDGLVQRAGLKPHINFASLLGRRGVSDSRIRWQVRVLPAEPNARLAAAMPFDASGNHYFAARETDAAFVRVNAQDKPKPAEEHEKFLFYRGVANFKTPLVVTLGGGNEESFQLRNTGAAELRHLFILIVRNGRAGFTYLDGLAPGKSLFYDFDGKAAGAPLGEISAQLSQQVKGALTDEGLYDREAAAMVRTWRDSWFEEEGVRVIYTLPRAWTDETLPLTLQPPPREVVRVMVGRAEIIAPTTEWQMLKQIVRYSDGDADERRAAVNSVCRMNLGRFFQPAVQLVLGSHPNREFSRAAWELLQAATKKDGNASALAAK
jgi:hypothetical protein